MNVRCPVCGAEFEVPETVTVTECPYCGTVIQVKTGEKTTIEHYYFPLDRRDPYDLLMRFIERQYGVPADIRSATFTRRILHIVPVYFYHLHGKASVTIRSRKLGTFTTEVEEVDDIGIPAISGNLNQLLTDYPFPLRGKKFFEEKVKRMGQYYEPILSKEEADKQATLRLERMILSEARSSGERLVSLNWIDKRVVFKGLVHYPVWELEYSYKGEKYLGYVDGATGAVIKAEHPLSQRGRAIQLTAAGLILALGFLTFFLVYSLLKGFAGIYAGGSALLASLAGASPLFTRGVRRKIVASEIEIMKEEERSKKPEIAKILEELPIQPKYFEM